ncbi:uncharacterized protein BXZ73DRAFT_102443 [Epithele typhae]|uniref:uncharacterized protein n=1 Tax=Epithele typhae TaxID=378194 RepID=UPI0020087E5E|nr:uncharacterized protein BXZ73DRAFT_102443 [Epithele typhae]KAH9927935.1 hypothetical protein BXZ73DRAFT_102443 [Epithele typhae]
MSEEALQKSFTNAVNDSNLVPGLKMVITSNRPDEVAIDPTGQKSDAAFFHSHSTPTDDRPHWGDQIISVEFKSAVENSKYDAFDDADDVEGFAEAASRKKVRGQLISYAELLLAVQQRHAVFTLFVIGRQCRFVCWERSGAIATKLIDYYDDWERHRTVREGVRPARRMNELADPRDSDVNHNERDVEANELNEGHGIHGEFVYVRKMFADSLVEGWPRHEVEIVEGGKTFKFWIAKPHFIAKGLAGRGTRGYVAYWVEGDVFVWLKDSWRAVYALVDCEGDILGTLNGAGAPNVPTLLCHGDVLDLDVSVVVLTEDEKPPLPSPDVLVAHGEASSGQKLPEKILHRDISSGNILIYPRVIVKMSSLRLRWRGLLADWEMSKPIVEDEKPRQSERTGTWQFQAVSLLRANSRQRAGIPEELESVWHVLLYHAVRYLPSTLSDEEVALFLDEFFDVYRKVRPSRLNMLIHDVLKSLFWHYAVQKFDEARRIESKNSAMTAARSGDRDDDGSADQGPSTTERLLAQNMTFHGFFVGEISDAKRIASTDRSQKHDRVPTNWVSPRRPPPKVGTKVTETQSRKKRKVALQEAHLNGLRTEPSAGALASTRRAPSKDGAPMDPVLHPRGQSDLSHVRGYWMYGCLGVPNKDPCTDLDEGEEIN